MKYVSTRGGVTRRSFVESMLSGYLSEGGIVLPENVPRVSREELSKWVTLSYPELCKKVLQLFIDEAEISKEEIGTIVDKSYTEFEHPEVVTTHPLQDGVTVGELFHGPTGAFKDLALCLLGQCLELVLSKRQKRVTILVGTSGDTGSSAARSVRGLDWANIIVLYPANNVSKIQRLQMTTIDSPGVQVFAAEGTSDDLDVPIKSLFTDQSYVDRFQLCSINSINVLRVLCQCVHFLYLYFQVHGSNLDKRLRFYIPTGAAGHVTGGLIARLLTGFDLELVVCVNENDIMHRWIQTGIFKASDRVIPTTSNAMDIQNPYNIERLLFYLSNGDGALVKRLMTDFETTGSFTTPHELQNAASKFLHSRRVTEAERMETMKRVYEEHRYLLCPHTAIAVRAATQDASPETPLGVCLATATAAKFQEAVQKAGISDPVPVPQSWLSLFALPEKDKPMPLGENWEDMLRQAVSSAYHR